MITILSRVENSQNLFFVGNLIESTKRRRSDKYILNYITRKL